MKTFKKTVLVWMFLSLGFLPYHPFAEENSCGAILKQTATSFMDSIHGCSELKKTGFTIPTKDIIHGNYKQMEHYLLTCQGEAFANTYEIVDTTDRCIIAVVDYRKKNLLKLRLKSYWIPFDIGYEAWVQAQKTHAFSDDGMYFFVAYGDPFTEQEQKNLLLAAKDAGYLSLGVVRFVDVLVEAQD